MPVLKKDFADAGKGMSRYTDDNIYDILLAMVNVMTLMASAYNNHTHKCAGGAAPISSKPGLDAPSSGNTPSVASSVTMTVTAD